MVDTTLGRRVLRALPYILLLLGGALQAQSRVQDLKDSLPDHAALVERGGSLWLDPTGGDGPCFRILSVTPDGHPVLVTSAGEVNFDLRCLEASLFEGLPQLSALVERAGSAKQRSLYSHDPLFGPHLLAKDFILTPEAMHKRVDVEEGEILEKVDPLVHALLGTEALQSWPELSNRALSTSLGQLDDFFTEDELLNPAVFRRVVAFGGLRKHLEDSKELRAVEAWARKALQLQVATRWRSSDGHTIELLRSAFGPMGWRHRTPERKGFRRSLGSARNIQGYADLDLVVFQTMGSEPLSAEVWNGRERLIRWVPDEKFLIDQKAWDRARPRTPDLQSDELLGNAWPPHLSLMDLDGRLREIVTPHGRLAAPGESPGVTAFLDAAARALPDAAYLDLVPQILFQYCYDSPDPERPFLLGQQDAQGEVHQTIEQTLATACGGIMRGDCDDLAELCQAIASRGKRPGQIMDLGDHNAFATVRADGDGFVVEVLQTGEPLAFRAKTAPDALRKAYLHLAPATPFDPDQVPIAVRFEGENTRSVWMLSHRVYLSPEYAKIMIGVQRDWHQHTYAQALAKMEALVESGDRDPANLREIAGLHAVCGDYAEAARWRQRALDSGGDAALAVRNVLLWELIRAKREEEADKLAKQIVRIHLPALKKTAGEAYWTTLSWVASTLIREGRNEDLALELIQQLSKEMEVRLRKLVLWLWSLDRFETEEWRYGEESRLQAGFVERGSETIAFAIRRLSPTANDSRRERLAEVAGSAEVWLRYVAMKDTFEDSTILWRGATIGSFARGWLGPAFYAMVEQAPVLKRLPRSHDWRSSGLDQLRHDLPLVKSSLAFWYVELLDLFDERHEKLDRDLALRFTKAAREAAERSEILGVRSVWLEAQLRSCRLLEALVQEDEKTVAEIFSEVGRLDDKATRDDVEATLMYAVRFLPKGFWKKVLTSWSRHIDHRPTYFALAWGAVVNHAPEHALLAADHALARFPKDAIFAKEREAIAQAIRER